MYCVQIPQESAKGIDIAKILWGTIHLAGSLDIKDGHFIFENFRLPLFQNPVSVPVHDIYYPTCTSTFLCLWSLLVKILRSIMYYWGWVAVAGSGLFFDRILPKFAKIHYIATLKGLQNCERKKYKFDRKLKNLAYSTFSTPTYVLRNVLNF